MPPEILTFSGNPSEDVTTFLGSVKRVAITQGRQKDDAWIADYVESCLRGKAMKWFDAASVGDPSSFSRWQSLRRTFLERFDSSPDQPPAHTPPAAATAAAWAPPVQMNMNAPLPESIEEPDGKIKISKALILGDSGVGKSCLLTRYCGHGWIPSAQSTSQLGIRLEVISASFHRDFQEHYYWDAPGADHFKPKIAPFCGGMEKIWIVYDVTNRQSFDNVRPWLDFILRHVSGRIAVRLVGNKRDLVDKRTVTNQEGLDLAKALGIKEFYETSALTNEGVLKMRGWLPAFEKRARQPTKE
ncbi:GTP-binding protein [Tulasnella sp. JGI-2019a]|nr:GTP-binding protein [Tulasnella sp. JGI-2019a]